MNAIMMCAKYVRLLAEGIKAWVFSFVDPNMFPDIDRFLYELCARTLIMTYCDLWPSLRAVSSPKFLRASLPSP